MDGRTDRFAMSISRVRMLTRDSLINNNNKLIVLKQWTTEYVCLVIHSEHYNERRLRKHRKRRERERERDKDDNGPEWMPMRSRSGTSGMCRILNSAHLLRMSKAIVLISPACRLPLRIGNPLHTMYASPIVSTFTYSPSLLSHINTKNRRSFITVKAHCSMTHLKQQKSLGLF